MIEKLSKLQHTIQEDIFLQELYSQKAKIQIHAIPSVILEQKDNTFDIEIQYSNEVISLLEKIDELIDLRIEQIKRIFA